MAIKLVVEEIIKYEGPCGVEKIIVHLHEDDVDNLLYVTCDLKVCKDLVGHTLLHMTFGGNSEQEFQNALACLDDIVCNFKDIEELPDEIEACRAIAVV
jgi:uncharacterized protein YukJ